VAFPPSRHVSRKLRVFIDWIVELLAQHAPAIQPH
jgi:DNA-binding transcriptional LysR family regulator